MNRFYYLSSKKQIRPPPSLSAWQRYHSFWHVLLWETTLFSLLFYITFLFELEVQTGFQFFIDFSDSLQNGVYSTTKIRSFSSIKFKFMLLFFFTALSPHIHIALCSLTIFVWWYMLFVAWLLFILIRSINLHAAFQAHQSLYYYNFVNMCSLNCISPELFRQKPLSAWNQCMSLRCLRYME